MEQVLDYIETPQQEACDSLEKRTFPGCLWDLTWLKFLSNVSITNLRIFFFNITIKVLI